MKFLISLLAVMLMAAPSWATTTVSTALVGIEVGAQRGYVASGGSFDVESGGELDVESGGSLKIAGTAVTASAAEINTLSGGSLVVSDVTATAAEINTLDGVNSTLTYGELNILDGATLDVNELNILDGVTATATNLNALAGISSTASASELGQKEIVASISDLSGANSVAIASPAGGTISAIYITTDTALGGAGDTTVSAAIEGVAITDGAVTVASTATAYQTFSSSPSAANTVAIGDIIQLTSDGGGDWTAVGHVVVVIDL